MVILGTDAFKKSLTRTKLIIFTLAMMLVPSLLHAQTTPVVEKTQIQKIKTLSSNKPSKQITEIVSMVASPNACELSPLEEYCEMTFHIIWESPHISRFCLYADDDSPAIQCWNNSQRGSVELKFSGHILENSRSYLLIDRENGKTIIKVSVPISGTLKQRQRAQRRRRGFWRMF